MFQLTVRLTVDISPRLEQLAEHIQSEGMPSSRSDALRMCVIRGLQIYEAEFGLSKSIARGQR